MINSQHQEQQVGKYHLLHLLKRGEASNIYLAESPQHDSPVALKVFTERYSGDELAKFFAQATRLSHLRHPHLVSILDFGASEETTYIVMEYVPQGTLRERYPKGSIVPPTVVLRYVKQAADALAYLHDNKLIHRDIKPHNMLLDNNDDVKISDFGTIIVSHSLDPLFPAQYDFEGTVVYASPEQLQGRPQRSSDQYALGVVAYEWLCGIWPFNGDFQEVVEQHLHVSPPPLRDKNPALSPALEQVVMKALAKDPVKRFNTIRDFAEALEWATKGSAPTRRQFMAPQPFKEEG